jgi:S-adenosylmethionine decarboxylase
MEPVGHEWLIDASGCRAAALADVAVLEPILESVVVELDLHVLDRHWHRFAAPGGVTGLYLLTESHMACHTYPEVRLATFNLYCCRTRPDWPWAERLRTGLGAGEVRVRRLQRGGANDQ